MEEQQGKRGDHMANSICLRLIAPTIITFVLATFGWCRDTQPTKTSVTNSAPATSTALSPDVAKKRAELAKRVMDPEQYNGSPGTTYAAYVAAKQLPDVCAQLFCYCGCDLTDGHKNVLDCFSCDHAVDCEICKKSAIQALLMDKQGKTVGEIQNWVDDQFAKEYPFDKPSKALQEYRAHRLYKAAN